MKKTLKILTIISFVILFISCATVTIKRDSRDNNDKIIQLEQELGIMYFKSSQYEKAVKLLANVFKDNKTDGELLYYYGLSLEYTKQKKKALHVYKNYPNVSRYSFYRSKIEGRFHWLTRMFIREDIKSRILQEDKLSLKELSPEKIAVFPFRLSGGGSQYATLGKGISEMIITDLSQVKRLQLVERVRIQALMEEMALGQTGLIEEKSSAKFGKLLGAGKIIHGNVAVLPGNTIRLDASYWDILNDQFPKVAAMDDRLHNLFKLEKDIVFKIVEKMGIQLTALEREKIHHIPTRNMQAFLEYCRGLEKQDQGQFYEAEQYFKKALKLDPGFDAAKKNVKQSKLTGDFSGSHEEFAIEAGTQAEITGPGSQNLINDRLQNLGDNIGSSFIPGEESRESAQEAASEIGFDRLPDPPEPPGH